MTTKEKPPFLCHAICDSFFFGSTTIMVLFHLYFLLLCSIATSVAAREIKATNDYSFETYMQEFHKMYTSAEEYELRKSIFLKNLATIIGYNKDRESFEYYMDLNQFTDMSDAELPLGYDKSFHSAWMAKAAISSTARDVRIDIAALTTNLPSSIDWRSKGSVTTTVKNQGGCGSCWAFASTAALESHIAIQTGKLFSLSVQELVSCAPNPRECGGQGGCAGSTAELAYGFVAKHGVVEEWNFGYQSYHGKHVNCTIMEDTSKNLRGSNATNIEGAVASIVGFSNLASNHYTSLLLAVATLGPVVVNVAASGWGLYKGGVFDDDKEQNRDINHAVVLEGYGIDQETGQDYWLIRNR
jgi:cathepsin L